MRTNLPVYNVETKVRPDQYLISKTDKKGRLTYANPAFIEISGYTREELIGKAHNLIRHPDMPPAAFQALWDTLQERKRTVEGKRVSERVDQEGRRVIQKKKTKTTKENY